MKGKTAVILFNLGGPDKPESIRPFLLNFFMDPNIIQAPYPVRYAVSRLIANKRSKNEAGTAYGKLGGKSPLLENTNRQAGALQGELGPDYRVFVCMRYWNPRAEDVAALVKDYNPDQIVLMPLYPQFSTTTTRSSFQDWNRAAAKLGLKAPTRYVCCYPLSSGFIAASAARIRPVYQEMLARHPKTPPRILFSAHGLPEKIIKGGDPYQWQCEISARQSPKSSGFIISIGKSVTKAALARSNGLARAPKTLSTRRLTIRFLSSFIRTPLFPNMSKRWWKSKTNTATWPRSSEFRISPASKQSARIPSSSRAWPKPFA